MSAGRRQTVVAASQAAPSNRPMLVRAALLRFAQAADIARAEGAPVEFVSRQVAGLRPWLANHQARDRAGFEQIVESCRELSPD